MLQVARLAPKALGDATTLISTFLHDQWNDDGGAQDRAGASDLYYTVFATEGLIALREEPPYDRLARFLAAYADGDGLDLIHLCCLIRCLAALPTPPTPALKQALADRVARWRSEDGGYAPEPSQREGTLYHVFMAHAAHQDLGLDIPGLPALRQFVLGRACPNGSFSNAMSLPFGNVPSTAAAITVLRQHATPLPAPADTRDWLLARHLPDGGFLAVDRAPIPDLLSTATAIHALSSLGASLESIKDPCLDFIDTLWTGKAFCGSWSDGCADSEYTWYALLALGHLSLS